MSEQVCRDLQKFGIRGDVVFKTDQEPALVDLVKQICALRPSSRSCLTHSGVGDSKGNGLAERAVQSLEEMIRVHKLTFESRLKTSLKCVHPPIAWLVEHCADVLNRYNIGADGRTPYQRLKGRKFVGHMLEFGSSVMFRVSGKVHGGVMQERWFPGIWLGKKLHTEEHLVMKEDGLVVRSRAVRENSQNLTMEDYDKLINTPHDLTGTVKTATMRTVLPEVHAQEQELGSYKPRRAKITKNIIDKFGPTARCTKCRAITRGDSGMEAVGHSAACRERIEELMKANPDFRERVDRADERINKMLAEYLEKKDKEASEEQQPSKRARTEPSSTAAGSCDPIPQHEEVGDAEMEVPEASAETSKRTLEEPAGEERHSRRQRVEHLEAGLRGHVVGKLHRRRGVLQGSSVTDQLCRFSIDDQGLDAVSSKKWDFTKKEVERVKFLEEVDRRGPPLLWVHCQSRRRQDSIWLSVAACARQNRRRRLYVLHVPLGCDGDEKNELLKLVDEANGKMCTMKSGRVVTNWDRMESELERENVDVEHVKDIVVNLTETMSKGRMDCGLGSEGGLELHECSPLDDLVIPWDLSDQWDELTGKALDLEKVVKGREKELQKFQERRVYVHVPRDEAMQDREGKFVKTRWVQSVKGNEVRCRLVAQEFAKGDPREDLFAGTPPLFAARMLVSRTASSPGRRWTLMVLDVSCAFLYADIKRRVYIELPTEDPASASGTMVGKLEKALYGTRDAPQAWLDELSRTLTAIGFKMSIRYPGVYFHEQLEVAMVTHVDDLLCSGTAVNLEWVRAELSKKYELKGEEARRSSFSAAPLVGTITGSIGKKTPST